MAEETNSGERAPLTNIPPPPAEIVVRTMASDIASVAASGGGPPKPYPLKVAAKGIEKSEIAQPYFVPRAPGAAVPVPAKKSFFSSPVFLLSSLVVFLVLVFFASYYFVYPLLNPPLPERTSTSMAQTQVAIPPLEHKTFFGQLLDGSFILDIPSAISGLEADIQQVSSSISGLSGSFFEITPQNGNGRALSAGDFFTLIDGEILDAGFLDASFDRDFTFFLYKDKNGFWPGYILQLNQGQSQILLQSTVQSKIESTSSTWGNLFFAAPGAPAAEFKSDLFSGQPLRILNFANSSSVLAYGWFINNKYLIISTSLDGLRQAIMHL